jgi:peptidoglycan hydrolase CwlO-like protein
MKKGPLSNKEKEYITKNLSKFDGDLSSLAEKMDRSKPIVKKFADSLAVQEEEEQATEEPAEHKAGDLFARNEERGVTVMTESASMASYESKQGREPQTPARYRQFIHKIKD